MPLTEEQIAWLRRGLAMTPSQRLDWLAAEQERRLGLTEEDQTDDSPPASS